MAAGLTVQYNLAEWPGERARVRVADVVWPGDLYWRLALGVREYGEQSPRLLGWARELEERALAGYERRYLGQARVAPQCRQRLAIAYGRRGYTDEAADLLGEARKEDPLRAQLYEALLAVYGREEWRAGSGRVYAALDEQPAWLARLTQADLLAKSGATVPANEARLAAAARHRAFFVSWTAAMVVLGLLAQVGLACFVAWLIASMFGASLRAASLPMGGLRWSAWDVAEVLALMVFLVPVAGAAGRLAARVAPWPALSEQEVFVVTILQYAVGVCGPLGLVWYRAGRFELPRTALGLTWQWPSRTVATGLAAFGLSLLVAAGVRGWPLPIDLGRGALEPTIAAAQSWGAQLAVVLLICGVAPVAEEIIFRGFLYGWLRRGVGFVPVAAALISALIFAFMHPPSMAALQTGEVAALVPLVVRTAGGILCAFAFESSGSLVPPIMLHALWNFHIIVAPLLLVTT